MFDAVFNVFQAFNQTGFLFAGLVCFGLALLIIFAEIQTRRRCIKVQGRIVAVRCGGAVSSKNRPAPVSDTPPADPSKIGMMEAAGHYYYPVYEYESPDGKIIRAHSSSGSNMLTDKIVGTPVEILVNPDEPWEANARHTTVIGLMALIFIIPGALFTYTALKNFEFNILTALCIFGFIALFGMKIVQSIKPRDQWEQPSAFKLRRREERQKKMENPPGYIMSPEEFNARLKAADRYATIMAPVGLLIALGLLAGGYHLDRDMKELSARALRLEGTVTHLESRSDSDGTTYYPVIKFDTPEGKSSTFKDSFGSSPPMYKTGEKVKVMYDPSSPYRTKIDHGRWNNVPALACYGFGSLFLWLTLKSLNTIRKRRELNP